MTIIFARFTPEEQSHLVSILDRARDMFTWYNTEDLVMDLSAVHHTCPLRLRDLSEADDFNFGQTSTALFSTLIVRLATYKTSLCRALHNQKSPMLTAS